MAFKVGDEVVILANLKFVKDGSFLRGSPVGLRATIERFETCLGYRTAYLLPESNNFSITHMGWPVKSLRLASEPAKSEPNYSRASFNAASNQDEALHRMSDGVIW